MKTVNIDILKAVSKKKRKNYNQEFKKLKKGDRSEDTIHDARVAARRLNALLETLSIISNSSADKKLKKKIKNSRKKLGGTRDIQITKSFLIKNKEAIINFEFDLFEDFYKQVQKESLKEADQFINDFKRKKVNKKLKKAVDKYFKNSKKKISLKNLFRKIRNEKELLLSEFDLLNRNDKSSFHQLRKDLKKLRYKLEILNEINAGDYDIDNYKQFQDDLGQIQDIVVIKEILNDRYKAAKSKNELNQLNEFLDNEQNKLIDKIINNHNLFLELMEKI
ncbi:MAG: CHAD domain-containing protein [Bacillota bacterium]